MEQFADHTQHRRVAAHRTLEPHNHRWAGPISSSNDTCINLIQHSNRSNARCSDKKKLLWPRVSYHPPQIGCRRHLINVALEGNVIVSASACPRTSWIDKLLVEPAEPKLRTLLRSEGADGLHQKTAKRHSVVYYYRLSQLTFASPGFETEKEG